MLLCYRTVSWQYIYQQLSGFSAYIDPWPYAHDCAKDETRTSLSHITGAHAHSAGRWISTMYADVDRNSIIFLPEYLAASRTGNK